MSKGIDIPIEQLRSEMETYLWDAFDCNFYGRVFLNEYDEKKNPFAYDSDGNYIYVLQNDKKDMTVFFDVRNSDSVTGLDIEATVNILFACNLETLFPAVTTERATEYVIEQAFNFISTSVFEITGLTRGKEAFDDYDMAEQNRDDMQPYFLFAFETKVNYNFKNC